MNEEARLLALVWEAVSDWVSNSDKQDAANAVVDAFVEGGHDVETLFDAEGECNYLDRALTINHAKADEDDIDIEDEGY